MEDICLFGLARLSGGRFVLSPALRGMPSQLQTEADIGRRRFFFLILLLCRERLRAQRESVNIRHE